MRVWYVLNNLLKKVKGKSHLVIPFTQELESLGSLVHKDTVQVSRLYRTDLYGLLPPAHDLV